MALTRAQVVQARVTGLQVVALVLVLIKSAGFFISDKQQRDHPSLSVALAEGARQAAPSC